MIQDVNTGVFTIDGVPSERAPSVVTTEGLVLHLDARKANCYSGNQSTMYDLSGFGNNGTLTNGAYWTAENNGAIFFDGVNDSGSFNVNMSGWTDFTLDFWCKCNVTSGNLALAGSGGGGSYLRVGPTATGWFILLFRNGTLYNPFFQWFVPSSTVDLQGNNHILVTGNAEYADLFVNGKEIQRFASPFDGFVTYFQRFGNYANAFLWSGYISVFRLYNRLLTPDEAYRNYESDFRYFK